MHIEPNFCVGLFGSAWLFTDPLVGPICCIPHSTVLSHDLAKTFAFDRMDPIMRLANQMAPWSHIITLVLYHHLLQTFSSLLCLCLKCYHLAMPLWNGGMVTYGLRDSESCGWLLIGCRHIQIGRGGKCPSLTMSQLRSLGQQVNCTNHIL